MKKNYSPIIYLKDTSEVLSSFNYQVSVLPINYKEYVVGSIFFTMNRLVVNIESIDKLYLYKYKDGTTYDVFDNIKVKGNVAEYNYDKVELIRSTGSKNILYNEATQEVSFTGNAVIGLAYSSWAIADSDGNLYIACNIRQNGFSLKKRHFRPNIETTVVIKNQGYLSIGVKSSIKITGIKSTDYVGDLDLGIAKASITIEGWNSTDFIGDLVMNAKATIEIEGIYPIMVVDNVIVPFVKASVSIEGIRSTDYVQDITVSNVIALVSVSGIKSTDYIQDLPPQNVVASVLIGGLKSTNYTQDLPQQNVVASISVSGIKFVNYTQDLPEQIAKASVSIIGIKSTDYSGEAIVPNAKGSISISGNKYEPEAIWKTTPSTAYDGTVSIDVGTMNTIGVTNVLKTQYPPINYSFGYIMRVRVYSFDGTTFLGTTYRERGVDI